MFAACAFVSAGVLALADSAGPAEAVTARIHEAKEYTLRVSAPDAKDKLIRFRYRGDNDGAAAGNWIGWRVVPYSLPASTTGIGAGRVTLAFDFPGEKKPVVLRSRGPAEDIYLLRVLVGEAAVEKWLGKNVPASKLVAPLSEEEPRDGAERLEKVPPGLAAAVALGKEAYEAARPELVRRFNKSFLHYPPAAKARWSVSAGKDMLRLDTWCSDRMYYARLRVELRKTPAGAWEVTRVRGGEFFKGE